MATNRTKRTRRTNKPMIPKALTYFFETGDQDQSRFAQEDRFNEFLTLCATMNGPDIGVLWSICKDEIIRNWIKKFPCTRPFFWWITDAPGSEGLVFPVGFCYTTIPENQSKFLKEHGLLTATEKAHFKKNPELLEPEVIKFQEDDNE